jgi:hypothetical protein
VLRHFVGLAIKKQFVRVPIGGQVFPTTIEGFDEFVFLGTSPALDFFLFIVTIHITNNLKINVIPNPRQRTRAVFSA